MTENQNNNNLSEKKWKENQEKSKKKCKKLKKRYRKLQAQLEEDYFMSKNERKKIKKKLCQCKKKLVREKENIENLKDQLRKIEFSLMLSEEREKWKEEYNELEKKIIQLSTADGYSQWFFNLMMSEMMPGFVKRYGNIPGNKKEMIIDQDY